MGGFFLYISALGPKVWGIVSAGALLGLDPFIRAQWPWGAKQLDRIPPRVRRGLELALLAIAIFYAGFSAWHDDHEALTKATTELNAVKGERDSVKADRDEARRLLAAKENPAPALPARNPDGIYQLNKLVGIVLSPQVDISHGVVYFMRINDAVEFNDAREFEYRDLLLRLAEPKPAEASGQMAGRPFRALINVTAEIVGRK
jgi:hypothetical protein